MSSASPDCVPQCQPPSNPPCPCIPTPVIHIDAQHALWQRLLREPAYCGKPQQAGGPCATWQPCVWRHMSLPPALTHGQYQVVSVLVTMQSRCCCSHPAAAHLQARPAAVCAINRAQHQPAQKQHSRWHSRTQDFNTTCIGFCR
jgi:hypothetical protein